MRNFDLIRPKLLNYILGISLLTAVSGCQNEKSGAAPQSQRPPPAVTVAPVIKEEVTKTYELVGRTAAQKTVNLVARVQGYLEKRNFKEGEDIKKGDLLFIIEQASYLIEVKAGEAGVGGSQGVDPTFAPVGTPAVVRLPRRKNETHATGVAATDRVADRGLKVGEIQIHFWRSHPAWSAPIEPPWRARRPLFPRWRFLIERISLFSDFVTRT